MPRVLARIGENALGENGVKCAACGREDKFDFHVPNAIWEAVVPEWLQCHVVCLGCFDDLAAVAGVDYTPYIDTLYFAGDQATFTFRMIGTGIIEEEK